MSEFADISKNSAPDADCFFWCHVQIIAHLCLRNSEILIKLYIGVRLCIHVTSKPKYDHVL